uniref:Macaca fascicularis brain cDNA, clone: QmoA-11065 n=1 Tax=Macaca fascicularis TaxID=9541 RepID=I7GJ32_MACFA|nr:unnamed protein product [Macaca fascicularis]
MVRGLQSCLRIKVPLTFSPKYREALSLECPNLIKKTSFQKEQNCLPPLREISSISEKKTEEGNYAWMDFSQDDACFSGSFKF